ncbi:MAG: hypothetical protein WC907_07815 [Acholeplasmataceae bacterium]
MMTTKTKETAPAETTKICNVALPDALALHVKQVTDNGTTMCEIAIKGIFVGTMEIDVTGLCRVYLNIVPAERRTECGLRPIYEGLQYIQDTLSVYCRTLHEEYTKMAKLDKALRGQK